MILSKIWFKQALVNLSKTTNYTYPTDFCNSFVFEKMYLCLLTPNCTRNHVLAYTYCRQEKSVQLTGIFRMIDLHSYFINILEKDSVRLLNKNTCELNFYSLNVVADAVNLILITYMTVNFHNFFNTGWFHQWGGDPFFHSKHNTL